MENIEVRCLLEMSNNRSSKCKNVRSAYFDDGKREVDFILAYMVFEQEDPQVEIYRQQYIQNLQVNGLHLEEESCKTKEVKIHFIKVHATFDALCEAAEDLKMKMPIAPNDIKIKEWHKYLGLYDAYAKIDPCNIKNPKTKPIKNYFARHFNKDHLEDFVNGEKPDEFFTVAQRGQLVYYILGKTKFGPKDLDIGYFHLKHKGVFIDAYPLHDGPVLEVSDHEPANDRQKLQADWASIRMMFKYQPIHAVKDYFGEKVALYFAWIGYYTSFLIPAAIVGLLCFIYGIVSTFKDVYVKEICDTKNATLLYMCPLCDKACTYRLLQTQGCTHSKITHFFDNQATLFFALFMSVWATLFLEFWKRKQISLSYEWHTMHFEEEEKPRSQYLTSVTHMKENPVTLMQEPYMPKGERASRLLGAIGVVLFFIVLVIATVIGVIVFRVAFFAFLIAQNNLKIKQKSKIINSICAAFVNLIAINLLRFIYKRIAVKITDWENPRTNTDYEDSFTTKMFWFQFCNTYSSIFYIAFFKGNELFTGSPGQYRRFTSKRYRFSSCPAEGCFLGLTIQLTVIMVGQQIIGNIIEIARPYLKNKFREWKNRKQCVCSTSGSPQWILDFDCVSQTKFTLFSQYLEIVVQYGFITMFVAAFPLAPLFALINNLVEIRLDAVNFTCHFRRPTATRAEDIGAWYGILATLTTFASIVNAFVLAFTSQLVPRLTYYYYKSHKIKGKRTMEGFLNYSLSYFPTSQFSNDSKPDTNGPLPLQEFCRYPGYHDAEAPYAHNMDYWIIMAARLAFVIAFQAVVLAITFAISYIIPDVPKALELKLKRENYLDNEAEKDHKEKAGKRRSRSEDEKDQKGVKKSCHHDEHLSETTIPTASSMV